MDVREFRCTGSVNKWSGTAMTGQLHSLNVPRNAYRRNIWLAFDALRSSTVAPWYLAGRISFFLSGSKITEFPISKGYYTPVNGINIFAPSTGAGMQPALRATAWETYAQDYKSVDMPCFTFDVECDEITLDIDVMILGGTYLVWQDLLITKAGSNYTQAGMDSVATNYWKLAVNGHNTPTADLLWVNNLFTVTPQGSATVGGLTDIATKAFKRFANDNAYFAALTSMPAVALYADTGAPPGSGATFAPVMDGKADLITGLIVASQYPGGL